MWEDILGRDELFRRTGGTVYQYKSFYHTLNECIYDGFLEYRKFTTYRGKCMLEVIMGEFRSCLIDFDEDTLILSEDTVTIKLRFQSEYGGYPVVKMNDSLGKFVYGAMRHYNKNKAILDLSESDLSNIIDIDSMLFSVCNDYTASVEDTYDIKIIWPKGDRRLHPAYMNSAFSGRYVHNFRGVTEGIDFSNVVEMSAAFKNSSIDKADISKFNCKHLTNCTDMFSGCRNLKSVKLGEFFDEIYVEAGHMFKGCSQLQELDLDNVFKYITNGNGVNCMLEGVPNLSWYTKHKELIEYKGTNKDGMYKVPSCIGIFRNTGASLINFSGLGFVWSNIDGHLFKYISLDYILTYFIVNRSIPQVLAFSCDHKSDDKHIRAMEITGYDVIECDEEQLDTICMKAKLLSANIFAILGRI